MSSAIFNAGNLGMNKSNGFGTQADKPKPSGLGLPKSAKITDVCVLNLDVHLPHLDSIGICQDKRIISKRIA